LLSQLETGIADASRAHALRGRVARAIRRLPTLAGRALAFSSGLILAASLAVAADAAAPPANTPGPADGALDGPWHWLAPEMGTLELVPPLMIGPWLEPAVSRDAERRAVTLQELRAPEIKSESRPPSQAPILRQAALESARLLEAAGQWRGAAEAYAGVVEAEGRVLVDVWHGLALARARSGDARGAEHAFLKGLEASGRASDQVRLRFDLAGFYARQGRVLESLAVIDALVPHARGSRVLARSRAGLLANADLGALLEPRASALEWPAPGVDQAWRRLDPRVADVAMYLPSSLRAKLLPWAERAARQGEALRLAALLGMLASVLLVGWVLLRQRGDVTVALEYPEELRGIFLVRLRRGHRAMFVDSTEEEIRRGGASTRREHHLVSRETQFQRLFTGRYQVTIDGLLVDPNSDEVLARLREEKMVRVRHRRTVRVEFDVHPASCPVDLEMRWGDRPAHEAQVTVPGQVEKPRATSNGKIRILLPPGEYHVLVGCGDRVFDRQLSVSSFRPTPVVFDVLEEEAVFKGCPPAVVPYLTGDVAGVARALERDGQAAIGYRLLARMHQGRGEVGRAADFYESAGDLVGAAQLRLEQGDPARAATLFEDAEAWLEAADAHRREGATLRAGECFERALDYDRAIDCYRQAGAIDRWLTALERCGHVFEAAQLAIDHQQRPRAIRLLQRVEHTDPDFREACSLLAEAFETEGHYDLAAGKLDEYIATFRPAHATGDTYSRLSELWEQAGHYERALDVLEDLRRREPTFPNIAARIEALRKQRSASGHLFTSGSRTSDGSTTAFVGNVRYELLEEVGRGGMGIVYRALDTRLDRIVALKRLPEDLLRHHPRALQFFLREAQSAARLNHPNIVTVYDADRQDGQFFITMELLEGQPLQTVLRERGQLSPSNLLGIARQTCRGLDYAHGQGVIHRDIKTANLFVTTDRIVKIMDFGLAKVLEQVRGGTTMISGTPYYMSPEQVIGTDVDHRSDLYSLGVTLFELATGSVPFRSGEVAYHHRHTPVPDPRELRPDLPEALAKLIVRLLQKEPDARLQSATAVLAVLTTINPES
jgi:tetratricopeptide (TPR) repeat protein